jgi:hypothetical protein
MQKLYGSQEAAKYLGISVNNLKYHVHSGKNINAQLIGNSLVFTQDELDRFLSERRKPGRPSQK